jgi:hypothetical protein
MTRKPQTKWIVSVRSPEGKLSTTVMKIKPKVGQKLSNGDEIIKVN